MADPVSGEPQNWDNDILLKITMPGKELRESTKFKQQAAVEKYQRMEAQRQAQPQMNTPIIRTGGAPIIQQIPQPVFQPAPVPSIQQNITPQPSSIVTQKLTEEQQANMPIQNDGRNEVDLLSKLANPSRSADQEWEREMIQRTEEPKPFQPIQQVQNVHRPESQPQTQQGFYTNYPGLEMKPKYNIWTIEPEKEDSPEMQQLNPMGEKRAEDFASKIIGSDLVWSKIKK